MVAKSAIDSNIWTQYREFFLYWQFRSIVIWVIYEVMLGKIVTNWAVSALMNIFFWCRIFFILGSTVYGLFDNLESEIMRREFSFEDRRALTKCWHYRRKWNKHVVEVPWMIDASCFISNLEARTSHAKMHGIHVNLTRKRFFKGCLLLSFRILVYRR